MRYINTWATFKFMSVLATNAVENSNVAVNDYGSSVADF